MLIVFSNANKKVMQKVEKSDLLRKYDSRFFDTIQVRCSRRQM